MKFRELASRSRGTKQVFKHARRRNWRYYNVSRDENHQRENEIDSPSFNGFDAQFDCKLAYGNETQSQLTFVWYI